MHYDLCNETLFLKMYLKNSEQTKWEWKLIVEMEGIRCMEDKLDSIDEYLVSRVAITENMDLKHISEVGGYCPLCGKYLLGSKGERIHKKYQIAHIYPNSPTEHQKKELMGLERLGENCEDFENKIVLCKDCHGEFDDHTTKEEYLKILDIKKKLLESSESQEVLSNGEIEKELLQVIRRLTTVSNQELENIGLKYRGIKISNKIEDDYILLKRKIEFEVCTYYGFIKESMKNYSDLNQLNFELVSSEIRTAYLKAAAASDNKEMIFNNLVVWLNKKIPEVSKDACEIMISFFVQNCEVFDEISK